jgi:hypothetical protein
MGEFKKIKKNAIKLAISIHQMFLLLYELVFKVVSLICSRCDSRFGDIRPVMN